MSQDNTSLSQQAQSILDAEQHRLNAQQHEALQVTNFLSDGAKLPERYRDHISVNAVRYPTSPTRSIWTATFRHMTTGALKNAILEYDNGVVRVLESDIAVANREGQA